jgi:hypothetical protein
LHGLHAAAALQGLHGLHAAFAAEHGLHGLQALAAEHGLQAAFAAEQGLHAALVAAHGLQALVAAQGLHAALVAAHGLQALVAAQGLHAALVAVQVADATGALLMVPIATTPALRPRAIGSAAALLKRLDLNVDIGFLQLFAGATFCTLRSPYALYLPSCGHDEGRSCNNSVSALCENNGDAGCGTSAFTKRSLRQISR